MNQRLQVVAMFVLAVASFGSVALAWKTLAASQALAEQSQASNAELIKELRGLVSRLPVASQSPAAPVAPVEWNRVGIRCVSEKAGGKPLAGVSVEFGGNKPILTNADGVADLGLMHIGPTHLTFTVDKRLQLMHTIQVRPGEDFEETFVCPPAASQISVSMPMILPNGIPPALKSRIWCRVVIWRESGGFDSWSETFTKDHRPFLTVFLAPDGKIWPISDPKAQLRQQHYQESDSGQPVEISPRPAQGIFAKFAASRIELSKDLQPVDSLQLPQGCYRLSYLLAVSDDLAPHAFFILPNHLALSTLYFDSTNGPSAAAPIRLAGSHEIQIDDNLFKAQWPAPNIWKVEVSPRELENVQFLSTFSAEAVPMALISVAYQGRKVPTLTASDHLDFLLDDKVILSGVPVFSQQVLNDIPSPQIYLFASLLVQEVDLFRQIQQGSWGASVAQRFRVRIRPGTTEEQRGTLPADFEEQLKNLPRPPNESI